jgi:hypothetical protein
MVIRKIGVLSCGKVSGALYALAGLLIGACVALFSLVGAGAMMAAQNEAGTGSGGMGGMFGAIFGVGAIIFLPLVYGILGFIGGLITALLYNLVAGFVGGIEVDLG